MWLEVCLKAHCHSASSMLGGRRRRQRVADRKQKIVAAMSEAADSDFFMDVS